MIPSQPLLPSARLLKAGMLWRSSTAATEKTPAVGCVPDIRTKYSKAATPIWTKNFLNWTASFARRLFRTNRSLKDERNDYCVRVRHYDTASRQSLVEDQDLQASR